MSGIDLSGLTLVCRSKTHHIPFHPPMKTYREARERVVALDQTCLAALGRSDVTVRAFLPPTGLYAVEFAVIALTFVAFSQRWWFARGEVVERVLGPGFARFSWTMQPFVISVMLSFHLLEMLYCMRYKLVKHSVNPRTALFWKWAGTTFVEGGFALSRFNGLVRREREAKAKQKR